MNTHPPGHFGQAVRFFGYQLYWFDDEHVAVGAPLPGQA